MGRDAQKRHFQALFSHSDKFFRYEMSGNFERKKGKASKDFPLHSPLSSTDTRSVFVVCFHQASVVTAQVDRHWELRGDQIRQNEASEWEEG